MQERALIEKVTEADFQYFVYFFKKWMFFKASYEEVIGLWQLKTNKM